MKKVVSFFCFFLLLSTTLCFAQDGEVDAEGAKDYKLMSRLPGYYISQYTVNDFDSYASPYIQEDNLWEGESTRISYSAKEQPEKKYSVVQIVRNYENAVKKLGGTVLYSEDNKLDAKLEKDGQVTYIELVVYNDGQSYELFFVEKKEMKDEVIVTPQKQ